MKNMLKILLFLVLLPLLIVFGAIVLLPVLFFLLVLICFIPSVRVFHLFQTRQTAGRKPDAAKPGRTASEDVIDVECTVTETTEGTDPEDRTAKQLDSGKDN